MNFAPLNMFEEDSARQRVAIVLTYCLISFSWMLLFVTSAPCIENYCDPVTSDFAYCSIEAGWPLLNVLVAVCIAVFPNAEAVCGANVFFAGAF